MVRGVTESGQRSLLDAALGQGPRREIVRQEVRRPVPVPVQVQNQVDSVSIMGAARGTTWVRVDYLAKGTTAEDVMVRFSVPSALSMFWQPN